LDHQGRGFQSQSLEEVIREPVGRVKKGPQIGIHRGFHIWSLGEEVEGSGKEAETWQVAQEETNSLGCILDAKKENCFRKEGAKLITYSPLPLRAEKTCAQAKSVCTHGHSSQKVERSQCSSLDEYIDKCDSSVQWNTAQP
jgi:hypothetical protein